MTTQEFSNEFDILYNNIMSNKAPGLNGYEKSVFLTQAQEAFIQGVYTGNFNGIPFEGTEEMTEYINSIIKQETIDVPVEGKGMSENSTFYQLPEDLWFITYESVIFDDERIQCKVGKNVIVKPVTQDSFYYTDRNPFRGSNERKVLRLLSDNKAELVSRYKIKSYTVRYIPKPSPIILEDLTNYDTSINGITDITECMLNTSSHRTILKLAVQLAKNIWESNNKQ